ncbi:hypothetical protein ORI20_03175 [Mycobacterium sp. CVI_P3]|uniref:Uncharacterized protein n=1 Tax=Mycobacterium pinniadriaticum TaxID=2994102 RepID=A0ABT3S873_9MYCO|nr:hypothetical protein [Mycobacterium pinniadriaticum]MCX2929262.1 hypothetical protein [Mycobacterium pinniadriaticum]MCX2935687.1 hypothetical protein [Mycobacterium pinniadriaticum]
MTVVTQLQRSWRRFRRRLRYEARHGEGSIHPMARLAIIAGMFVATAALAGYALAMR